MQNRVTRKGMMMIFGIVTVLAAVTVMAMQPGDAAAGSGRESKTDPGTVVSHAVENAPGYWTPEKMDQAEPMPLLSPDHETGPAAEGAEPAGSRTSIGKPHPPRGTGD